jgi:NTP pyrophosphatase (non-canonical NTP hydrolase)
MFESAMFLEIMEKLIKECHETAAKNGFWKNFEVASVPCKVALMHSELSELLEAHRKGNPPCEKKFLQGEPNKQELLPIRIFDSTSTKSPRPITSMEEECADLFIRLLDFCGGYDINLASITLAKMEYNKSREYMHGKKY